MEQSQPYPVVAVVAENLQSRLWLPIIFEHHSLCLGLGKERKVGPNSIVLYAGAFWGGWLRQQQAQRKQPTKDPEESILKRQHGFPHLVSRTSLSQVRILRERESVGTSLKSGPRKSRRLHWRL